MHILFSWFDMYQVACEKYEYVIQCIVEKQFREKRNSIFALSLKMTFGHSCSGITAFLFGVLLGWQTHGHDKNNTDAALGAWQSWCDPSFRDKEGICKCFFQGNLKNFEFCFQSFPNKFFCMCLMVMLLIIIYWLLLQDSHLLEFIKIFIERPVNNSYYPCSLI